ncbi:procollagen C-endopeptidase enhancer 2b isoform X2 [Dunckerocampus dactyliophorus]|uniref:procollagen C-endopeptidase enhancer 2b isoform X2 n=1 Tax=Dunckerocampus dactyliophorus TaxID=161453 RepID=UPI002404990F|nr:procollagen C-endopeptidase enhancer 2b isoform X2 [Dunckerocampus dactyliophorus]
MCVEDHSPRGESGGAVLPLPGSGERQPVSLRLRGRVQRPRQRPAAGPLLWHLQAGGAGFHGQQDDAADGVGCQHGRERFPVCLLCCAAARERPLVAPQGSSTVAADWTNLLEPSQPPTGLTGTTQLASHAHGTSWRRRTRSLKSSLRSLTWRETTTAATTTSPFLMAPKSTMPRRLGNTAETAPQRRPVLSEGNQLVIQFLSDLSLTADGFIGHYKFRPKKFSITTTPPPTTTQPATSRPIPLKHSVALCRQKCKRRGTLESNFCSSNFAITGTVISAVPRGGSVSATVSIINVYKEGNLAIQQAGKTMSTKILILCKKCPFVRRGLNYIFMGHVDQDGRGTVGPQHFVLAFKSKNQKALGTLKNKRC